MVVATADRATSEVARPSFTLALETEGGTMKGQIFVAHGAESGLTCNPVDERLGRAGDEEREVGIGDAENADRIGSFGNRLVSETTKVVLERGGALDGV